VYMSPIKETNYFSDAEIKQQGLFYNEEHISTKEEYAKQFENAGTAKAIGEASVSYLFYPSVPLKIKQFNPLSKIIVVLRNPVDRGYSHYLMDKRLGLVKLSYEDILYKRSAHPLASLYYQQYVELGLYYKQLKRYLDIFERKAVKIFLYDELIADTGKVVKEIYQFLEVDDEFRPETDKKHNTYSQPKNALIEKLYQIRTLRKIAKQLTGERLHFIEQLFLTRDKKPAMPDALKTELIKLYAPDLNKVQALIDKDLSGWLK